jgi:hypothetical protein
MTKLTHEHRLFLAITLAIAVGALFPAETADRALTCLNIGALVFAVRAGEGG